MGSISPHGNGQIFWGNSAAQCNVLGESVIGRVKTAKPIKLPFEDPQNRALCWRHLANARLNDCARRHTRIWRRGLLPIITLDNLVLFHAHADAAVSGLNCSQLNATHLS